VEDKLEKLKKKNDLSDIILEKDSSSNEKVKKLLLGVASLVLLFLIILIVMKMFNNSNISPSENLSSVGDKTEITDSDLLSNNIDDSSPSTLFKEEPIIDETSDTDLKFEEMVRRLKQQDSTQSEPIAEAINEQPTVAMDQEKKTDDLINKIKDATSNTVQTANTKIEETIQEIKPQVNITSSPVKTIKPVTITQPEVITIREPKPIKKAVTSYPLSTINGYFIQVGATYQSFPNKSFLAKIKNSGYDYVVHKVSVKGRDIKKVLVGPYGTRDQARADLNNVKNKINPSAYIYRIR
jgi:DedD protein